MGQTIYVGLALASFDINTPAVASFDNVTVTSGTAISPDFSLLVANSAVWGTPGTTAQTAISQIAIGNFSDSIAYSTNKLPSCVTANFSPTSIAGSGSTTLSFLIASNCPAGTYSVIITGADTTSGNSRSAAVSFVIQDPNGPLPVGWNDIDINSTPAGSSRYGGGVFTVNAGYGVHFAFTSMIGDGRITARLLTVPGQGPQGGIMIQDGLGSAANNVSLSGRYGTFSLSCNTCSFQSYGYNNPTVIYPQWLQLVRLGNSVMGYVSTDGAKWTTIGTVTIPSTSSDLYVGLWASSGYPNNVASAIFDNVTVTSVNAGFSVNAPVRTLTTTPGVTIPITIVQASTTGFADTVNYSANGLPPGATGTFNPSAITGAGNTLLTITLPQNLAAGGYELAIIGTDTNSGFTSSIPISLIIQSTSGGLPADWNSVDIGSTPTGSAQFGGGVFSIEGGGAMGIGYWPWDNFRFTFTGMNGDGSIIARLVNAPSQGQVGIMVRDGMDAASSNVFVATQNGNPVWSYRSSPGAAAYGPCPVIPGSYGCYATSLPQWFKLVRQGSTFSAFVSPDGIRWTQFANQSSSINVPMSEFVEVGLAVSSDAQSLAQAVFDNVTVTPSASGFDISSEGSIVTGAPGNAVPLGVFQTATSGFSDAVEYSVSGLPNGA